MKVSRTAIVVIIVAIVGTVGFVSYSSLQSPGPACSATWKCAAVYPVQVGGTYGVAGLQCGINSSYVYCVGGVDADGGPRNGVYTGTISASGNVTGWIQDHNSYPQNVTGETCAVSSGYMYCIGGISDSAGDDLASSYYASLEGNGTVGGWHGTTPYPIPIDSESCVVSSSYVYCMGGNNETGGVYSNIAPSDTVWYAQLSPAGIGVWARTTSYPSSVYVPSCVASGGFAFCVGGADPSGSPVDTSYYAPLTSGGVGEWIQSALYPIHATGQACAAANGRVYCVGGETSGGQSPSFSNAVYSAQVAGGGLGTWTAGPSYPDSLGTSCVASSSSMYCFGGFDGTSVGLSKVVNFASLSSLAQS